MPLLGLSLVVLGERGPQLALQYPTYPTYLQKQETPRGTKATGARLGHLPRTVRSRPPSASPGSPATFTGFGVAKEAGTPPTPFPFDLGFSSKSYARLCMPQNAPCDDYFEWSVDQLFFLSYPVTVPKHAQSSLSRFSIVLIFDLAELEGSHPMACYRDCIRKTALGILYEQERCSYLASNTGLMLQIRDELLAVNGTESAVCAELLHRCLTESRLANELKTLCSGLMYRSVVRLQLNAEIHIQSVLSDMGMQNSTENVKPYHTMLLHLSSAKLISELPEDTSPLLIRFVEHVTPMKSFAELALDIDISLQMLIRCAQHLVRWKKGSLIDAITKNSIYASTLALEQSQISFQTLQRIFAQLFPAHSLVGMLSRFSAIKPLQEHVKDLNRRSANEMLRIVVWLLQRGLLKTVHSVAFAWPRLNALGGYPRHVRRVLPLLNGKHTLQDIMWAQQMSRTDLDTALAALEGEVVVVYKESTGIYLGE